MYKYFKSPGGMGIIGIGKTKEKSYEEAAKATFNLIVDVKKVEPKIKICVECTAEDDDDLLVEWVNRLLKEYNMGKIVFSKFKVERIKGLRLFGCAEGEKLDKKKHGFRQHVPRATHEFSAIGKDKINFRAKLSVELR